MWSIRCPACALRPQTAPRVPARLHPGQCSDSPPCWSQCEAYLQSVMEKMECVNNRNEPVESDSGAGFIFVFSTCDFCLFRLHQLSHHWKNVLSPLRSNKRLVFKDHTGKWPYLTQLLQLNTWGLALAMSRSCSVTSWTISFFLCTSPLGSGTYSSASKSNSVAKVSQRPCLCKRKDRALFKELN